MSTTIIQPAVDPTEAQKFTVKLLLKPAFPDVDTVVAVLQQWIRDQSLPGHLLLDVANYKHVQNGPGIVLVSHEAHIHLDYTDGLPGLLYKRRTPQEGTFAERLKSTLKVVLSIAARLQNDPALTGQFQLDNHQLLIGINDRLLAPNAPATYQALTPILTSALKDLTASTPTLEPTADPLRAFEVKVTLASDLPVA